MSLTLYKDPAQPREAATRSSPPGLGLDRGVRLAPSGTESLCYSSLQTLPQFRTDTSDAAAGTGERWLLWTPAGLLSRISPLLLPGSTAWGKFLNLPVPQLLHLENEVINVPNLFWLFNAGNPAKQESFDHSPLHDFHACT